jgi:hypothetical protein
MRWIVAGVLAAGLLLPTQSGASPRVESITATDVAYGTDTTLTYEGGSAVRVECRNQWGHVMWASEVLTPASSPVAVFTSGWPTEAGTVADCTAYLYRTERSRKAIATADYRVLS